VVCGTVECGSPGGIREVCTTEQLTLPVEFLGMTGYATDGGVVLEWRTATERDSRWFEVLRSIDLAHWDSLCELPAAGNSYSTKVYRWTDIDPELGLAYYRLDGIDIDGSKTMLMILPITWHGRSGSSLGPWDLLGRRIK